MTENELYHYGILGQKWGVRRFQNPDGSLTAAGKKRYLTSEGDLTDHGRQALVDAVKAADTSNKHYSTREEAEAATLEKAEILDKVSGGALSKAVSKVESARNELVKADKFWDEYNNNDQIRDKYKRKAAEKIVEEYGGDVEDAFWAMKYDDLDQGSGNSYELFVKDKLKNNEKAYNEYAHNVVMADIKYQTALQDAVKSILGKYENATYSEYGRHISFDMETFIEKMDEKKNKRGNWVAGGAFYLN